MKCCPEKSQKKEIQTAQMYQEQLRSKEGGLVLLLFVDLQVDLAAAQELLFCIHGVEQKSLSHLELQRTGLVSLVTWRDSGSTVAELAGKLGSTVEVVVNAVAIIAAAATARTAAPELASSP